MKTWLLIFAALTASGCVKSKEPTVNSANVSVQTATATPSANPLTDGAPIDLALNTIDLPGARFGEDQYDAYVKTVSHQIDRTITYEHLKKNADRYNFKVWDFTGKILEISEKDGMTIARIGIGPYGAKPIWVKGRLTTEFVENDRVYVIGMLAGDYTYKSQANWTITIPSLAALAIMKPEKAKQYAKGK